MSFQQNQRDAHASTMAGSTKMARASAPAANTSVPASTALSAALLYVATSCPQPHHPAPTHDWSGYQGSAASASTAIRAPGGSHISIRLVVFLFKAFLWPFMVLFDSSAEEVTGNRMRELGSDRQRRDLGQESNPGLLQRGQSLCT